MLWGGLSTLVSVIVLGLIVYVLAFHGMPPQGGVMLFWQSAGYVMALVLGFVMAIGGFGMIQRTNMGSARTAAVMAAIPCLGCLVMPFGIWACVLLFSAAGERDFE